MKKMVQTASREIRRVPVDESNEVAEAISRLNSLTSLAFSNPVSVSVSKVNVEEDSAVSEAISNLKALSLLMLSEHTEEKG